VKPFLRSTPSSGAEIFTSFSFESLGIEVDKLSIHSRFSGSRVLILSKTQEILSEVQISNF
jgi:hypothetical protein